MGRKPTFTSAEEMQEKIDAYFASCERELLRDAAGNPVLNKNGEPVYVGGRPMTIQGLALALGFTSRQRLLDKHCNEFGKNLCIIIVCIFNIF